MQHAYHPIFAVTGRVKRCLILDLGYYCKQVDKNAKSHIRTLSERITRIPSGIWSRLYGWIVTTWLLWMRVLRIGSFPSALNTWSKVWPWILIWAYLIWNFAHTFDQQVSILDPTPYIGLFGPTWSEFSPYGWIAGGGGPRAETWLLKSRLLTATCERRD